MKGQNLFSIDQKTTTPAYREGWDRIFGGKNDGGEEVPVSADGDQAGGMRRNEQETIPEVQRMQGGEVDGGTKEAN
jgi:hypothetical protein